MTKLPSRIQKFTKILLQLIVFVVIYLCVQYYIKMDIGRGSVSSWTGQTLNGQDFSIDQMKGKSYLLHFWATWCHICALEKNSIDALARKYHVVTVASQSGSSAEVTNYMIQNNLSFPVIIDEHGSIARTYRIGAFPTSLFVNANGVIEFIEVGYTTELGLRARLKML